MSLTDDELERIESSIRKQNEEIQNTELVERLDDLSRYYNMEAENIMEDLTGEAGQRSIGLEDDLNELSKDIRKIHEDLSNGRVEDFRKDAHDMDRVLMDLKRLVLYALTAYNLAKKSNTIAKYNANSGHHSVPKTRLEENKKVMESLRNQMRDFHEGVNGLSSHLEEVNYKSNENLGKELGEFSKLIHYIEYFAETGTPDPEIKEKLEEIEEEYDRKASRNLKKARENAREKIDDLIRSQSREI